VSQFTEIEKNLNKIDDLRQDMMKLIKSLENQITIFISEKLTHVPPASNKTDTFPTNIGNRNCNNYGCSKLYCQLLRTQSPYVALQSCSNPSTQARSGQPQPKGVPYYTCHQMYPLGPKIC